MSIEIFSYSLSILQLVLLTTLLVIATVTDTRSRTIPNWLTYSSVLLALGINCLASLTGIQSPGALSLGGIDLALPGTIGIVNSFLGGVACLVVMLVLYDLAGTGGGDLKLATALGACLGVQTGLLVILWCHLMAGSVLLVWAVLKLGPFRFLGMGLRTLAAMLLPRLVAAPDQNETNILQTPIPLAGFFFTAVLLNLLGVHLS